MHIFVRSFVCLQGWVDSADWTGNLVCTRQASALPLSQLLASPVFRFLIKVCLSLESISSSTEKRKSVYVLKSDSDQLTERLPGPAYILQSPPTRLLSLPQLPSHTLFILASQRLGLSHQALYDLLLFAFLILHVPGSKERSQVVRFPVGRLCTMGLAMTHGGQAAWTPVSECKLRNCFRAWCFESSLHSLVCCEAQTG